MIKALRSLGAMLLTSVLLFTPLSLHGESGRVFDASSVLSAEETASLEEALSAFQEKTSWNVAVLTTDDAQGKTSQEYADDFYDTQYGPDTNGVVYLIDFDNRQNWISTSGEVIDYLTDSRIEQVLDQTTPPLAAEQYAEAMQAFIGQVSYFYDQGIPPNQHRVETPGNSYSPSPSSPSPSVPVVRSSFLDRVVFSFREWGMWALLLAAATGIITVVIIYSRYKSPPVPGASNYLKGGETRFTEKSDVFLRKYVQRVYVPPADTNSGGGSSTHTSSGGGTHGGGGRGF